MPHARCLKDPEVGALMMRAAALVLSSAGTLRSEKNVESVSIAMVGLESTNLFIVSGQDVLCLIHG